MSLLEIKDLSKSFGKLQILKNVSLQVKPGERHVIIGPNGAGKTTLFNCITGELPIDQGIVKIQDRNVKNLSPHLLTRMGMSRTFQKNNLFGDLTVEENIHLALVAFKPYRLQIIYPLLKYSDFIEDTHMLLQQWNLWERRKIKVNNLSYGEQRILEIVLAMASKPKILLLDEPTSGMSPAETIHTTILIQSLPRDVSLLVIEHDMEVVFSIANRITVLHYGEVMMSGSPEEIRKNDQVRRIYFGGGMRTHA